MYHVPFNSTHRYWTGLLLLIRIIVYLVAALTSSSESGTEVHFTIVSLLTVLLIIKGLTVRVYKKWLVDVLESVMIALTVIITVFDQFTLNTRISFVTEAVTWSTSIAIVCLLIGIITHHATTYVFLISVIIMSCQFYDNRGGIILATNSNVMIQSSVFSSNINMLRLKLITVFSSMTTITMTNFTENSEILEAFIGSNITMNQCITRLNYVMGSNSTRSRNTDNNGIVVIHSSVVTMLSLQIRQRNLVGL